MNPHLFLFYYIKLFHQDFITYLKHDIYSVYKSFDEKTISNAIKSNLEYYFIFEPQNFILKNNFFVSIINNYYVKISTNYCVTLKPETKIGLGFRIGHIKNIIIHSKTIFGNIVTISQGVTIGIIHSGKKAGTAILGERFYVGPNAVIIGNIKIGNDVIVAGNSFVNFDVPDNSVVVDYPGVIQFKENPTKQIISWL
jgi:serine O-acetyltransferase